MIEPAHEQQGRLWRWRHLTFGPASEQPYRRRTSDWFRLVLAVVFVALTIAHEGNPGDFERNLYELLNGLPNDLRTFFRALYGFGTLWALGLVVVAALVAQRWRLARDMAIAGVVAWFIGRLLGGLVVVDVDLEQSLDIVTRLGDATPSFPVVRLAVIVAVVVTAGPVPHPADAPARSAARPPARAVVRCTSAPAIRTRASRRSHSAGGSAPPCTSCSDRRVGGRRRAQVTAALAELGIDASHVDLAPDAAARRHA